MYTTQQWNSQSSDVAFLDQHSTVGKHSEVCSKKGAGSTNPCLWKSLGTVKFELCYKGTCDQEPVFSVDVFTN